MKVLLAVDGSPYTKHMLAFLAAHDELLKGDNQYTVLTVVPAVPSHAASFLTVTDVDGFYRDEAEKVLAPIRAFIAQQGWQAEFRHRWGSPGELIASEAESGRFDLLVMGSHGHSALANLVLGSVATRVLAQCKTPVLLVR